MDLRKYLKKRVSVFEVLNCDYLYYSHSQIQYGQPQIIIRVECNEGTAFAPGYSLLITTDTTGKVESICRLADMHGAGRLIKKFPAEVEQKAETILNRIVVSTRGSGTADLSALYDSHLAVQ